MNKIILCIGMKRSGSTLQFNIARLLLESQGRVQNLGYVQKYDLKNKLDVRVDNTQSLIAKCHNPDWKFGEKLLYRNKVLYIYRDLRAVYASMKLRTNVSLNDFICEMKEDLILYSKFENDKRVLVQKYEEIYGNEYHAVCGISNYLEMHNVNSSLVKDIVNKVSINDLSSNNYFIFNKGAFATWMYRLLIRATPRGVVSLLKKTILTTKLIAFIKGLIKIDSKTLMYADHISKTKGDPNIWKEILSNEEVIRIESEFNGWLKQHRYM